jgi:hypothetical protein
MASSGFLVRGIMWSSETRASRGIAGKNITNMKSGIQIVVASVENVTGFIPSFRRNM